MVYNLFSSTSCGSFQKRFDEAVSVVERLFPTGEGKAAYDEIAAAAAESQQQGTQVQKTKLRDILGTKEKRLALTAGVGIQVLASQFKSSIILNYFV